MKIKNIEGLKVNQIKQLVNQGAKFVLFPYTVSFVLMTLKRSSSIYFILPSEKSIKYSYPHVGVNLAFGWWGIPWGPIYTLSAIYTQIIGGKDVTQIVLSELIQNDPEADTTSYEINNRISNQETYNIPN